MYCAAPPADRLATRRVIVRADRDTGPPQRFGRVPWWYEESGLAVSCSVALTITALMLCLVLTPFKRTRGPDGLPIIAMQQVLADSARTASDQSQTADQGFARVPLSDAPAPEPDSTFDSPVDEPADMPVVAAELVTNSDEPAGFQELQAALEQARAQLAKRKAEPRGRGPEADAADPAAARGSGYRDYATTKSKRPATGSRWPSSWRAGVNHHEVAEKSFHWIAQQTGGKMFQCPNASELPATLLGAVEKSFASLRASQSLDLALVIDTTTSMHDDIGAVKQHLDAVIQELRGYQSKGCELRVGIVQYKDYGDEFVARAWPFTTDLRRVHEQIMAIQLSGGASDIPEAVYDGIACTLEELDWRAEMRTAVVIGDAPPHAPPEGSLEKSPQWLRLIARSREINVNFYPILVGK